MNTAKTPYLVLLLGYHLLYFPTGMDQILEQIEKLKSEITSAKTDTAEALESFRTRFLGTKGLVKSLMGEMKNVPAEQKKEFGQVMNAFKQFAEEKYESLRSSVTNGELSGKPAHRPQHARRSPAHGQQAPGNADA